METYTRQNAFPILESFLYKGLRARNLIRRAFFDIDAFAKEKGNASYVRSLYHTVPFPAKVPKSDERKFVLCATSMMEPSRRHYCLLAIVWNVRHPAILQIAIKTIYTHFYIMFLCVIARAPDAVDSRPARRKPSLSKSNIYFLSVGMAFVEKTD